VADINPDEMRGSAPTLRGVTVSSVSSDRDARIVTIPNGITLVRLLCVPVFVWLLFGADRRDLAAYLLAVLGATDWVDGWIARRFDQGSTLGKVLDPVADRLLLGVGVLAIIIDGSVPLVIGVIVVAREIAVSLGTVVLASLGAKRIDVTWVGKCGTFALMVAFPLFLISRADVSWADAARVLAWVAIVPAIVLSYRAAVGYIPIGRQALRDGREMRAARRLGG
jgi:cardiolipin synthase (CMP-forming)